LTSFGKKFLQHLVFGQPLSQCKIPSVGGSFHRSTQVKVLPAYQFV
jgi:hypothetical protein